MILESVLYAVSCLAHFFALIYGFLCIKHGEDIFCQSSPKNLLKSRVEQKYWTVNLGTLSNILLLSVMPLYILEIENSNVGTLEGGFAVFHFLDGIVTLIWHRMTLLDIKSGKLRQCLTNS